MTLINNRNGQQLAVYSFGDAAHPAIIFSNSLGTDHGMWQSQVAEFSQHYYVICYDTRGHGKSSVIENTSLTDLANDVLDILDHFQVEKAHFCGISMGGITGLQLGLIAPERFLSITIANSAAKIGQEAAWLSRATTVEADGLANIVSTTHTRWFSDKFDYIHDAIAQKTIQSLSVTEPKGYAASCRALAAADLREEISNIQVPCLALCGGLDPVTTVADGKLMQERIPQCEIAIVEASHLSNIEQPVQFNQVLSAFIAKH
ncbi:alpha/beta fold hydrolase [Acinetobacter thermotolerans]|uniref:alpha/beta fold hydrolase n=1 Tax=Acinetobacter thermotolerans TaxID=3151487 RepID=UPI00384B9664